MTDLLLDAWAAVMWKACWQGSLVVLAVWLICLAIPSMPARCQCWLWRLAILKFIVVFLLPTLVSLPLLPAPPVASPMPEVAVQIVRQQVPSGQSNQLKFAQAGQLNCQVFRQCSLFSGSSELAGHWLACCLLGTGQGNSASRAALSRPRR